MTSEAYLEQVGGGTILQEPVKLERRCRWNEAWSFPEDWVEDGYAYRKKHGKSRINVRLELHRFIGKAISNGYRYINWKQAFRNWLVSQYCEGEPEQEPSCPTGADIILAAKAKVWAKGLRTQSINIHDVKRAVELGLMTREQARKLGFHVALD